MRPVVAILLLLCVAGLGSGWLGHVHNDVHAREDARRAEQGLPVEHHDAGNCELHALLGGPMMSVQTVAVLIAIGLFVAFLTQLSQIPRDTVARLPFDSRGPPALVPSY